MVRDLSNQAGNSLWLAKKHNIAIYTDCKHKYDDIDLLLFQTLSEIVIMVELFHGLAKPRVGVGLRFCICHRHQCCPFVHANRLQATLNHSENQPMVVLQLVIDVFLAKEFEVTLVEFEDIMHLLRH